MKKSFLLLLVITIISACSSSKNSSNFSTTKLYNINKIGVVATESKYISSEFMENTFLEELQRKNYFITSRSVTDQVLKEIKIQRSDITERNAARIGKIMNVDAVLVVSVTAYNLLPGRKRLSNATVGAKLVKVENAEIIWVKQETFDSNLIYMALGLVTDPANNWDAIFKDKNSALGALTEQLARTFPSKYF